MKKLCVLFAVILMVSMLGGCYQSDTVVDVGYNNSVEVTSSLMLPKEINELMGANYNYTGYLELIDILAGSFQDTETEKRVEYVKLDETGNVIPEAEVNQPDGKMVGRRVRMQFDNFTTAKSSQILANFLPTEIFSPVSNTETGKITGLVIQEAGTLLGTKYTVSGSLNLYASMPADKILSGIDVFKEKKAEFEAEAEKLKDNPSQKEAYDALMASVKEYGDLIAGYEEAKAAGKASTADLTFKFPLSFARSNADKKSLLGNTMTWTATEEVPAKDVYFEVTVINPLILGMAIIILALLVVILVLLKKKKDDPDAVFLDEDGNEIPVYDVEDDEEFEEDGEDEAYVEECEEVEEIDEEEESENK